MESAVPTEAATGPAAILLLAVIQGVAEFLPISSSGHLVLARLAMGVHEAGLALEVALHLGTLMAVLWAFRADVRQLIVDLFRGRWGLHIWLVVATIPIGVVGMVARDLFAAAFQQSAVAGWGLLFTAACLVVGERARRRLPRGVTPAESPVVPRPPNLADAIAMGCAQVLALTPGVSRSGVTISAGLLRGMPAHEAARYSFLMSIPAVCGASIVELPTALREGFGSVSTAWVGAAVVVSAVVGWVALKVLLVTLAQGAFRWFAAYCALVGASVIVFGR